MKKTNYARSRVLYIIEAAVEYFISILIGGAYLAKIASEVGLSDSTTGIITSFLSLGQGFQIFALLLRNKTPVKRWVTALHIVNQCFFAFVWLVPVFPLSGVARGLLFVVYQLSGHVISYILMPAMI